MTLSAAPYRIIDPHVHVWKHDPRFPFAPEAKNVPAVDRTPETLLNLMQQTQLFCLETSSCFGLGFTQPLLQGRGQGWRL